MTHTHVISRLRVLFHLQPLDWRFILIFLPYPLVFFFDTLGWRYTFERTIPMGLLRLVRIQIIGKAVNVITPLAPIGGEPIKAYLLQRGGIPLPEGLASVVISRTVATIAQGLFILGITGVVFISLGLPHPLMKAVSAVLLAGGVLVGAFLLVQTRGLFSGLLGMARRLKLGFAFLEEEVRDLDRRIGGYYRHRKGRFVLSLTFHVLSWLVEGLEVSVLLMLLDLPGSFTIALGIAAFSSAIRAASFVIPGSLGIQEGGNVFTFVSFGFSPEAAMAFSILRRIRELGWSAVGWLLLSQFGLELRLPLTQASSTVHEQWRVR